MAGELERHLGELAGRLDRLFPALDRIEGRQHQAEERLTRAEERIAATARQVDESRERMAGGDRAFEGLRLTCADHEARVARLEKGKNTEGTQRWDLLKIFLAAALGTLLTLLSQWATGAR